MPTLPEQTIVVDQSSSPYDLSAFPGIEHVYDPSLSGLTAARNAAILRAGKRVVVFVDDDCIFESDVLAAILAVFAARPDAVAVQPAILSATSSDHTIAGTRSERVFSHGFFDSHTARIHPHSDRLRRMSGCSMAFRRELFTNELFDETLTGYGYGEDWEFSKRAARRGAIYLAPDARVRHDVAEENRLSDRRELAARWENFQYIYRKLRAHTTVADRVWYAWWMLGETLQWLRFGYGLPRSGRG